ncbi:uncharacterized protein LOC142597777 isoform X3 [Dermatophagoides farinae]|uniref:uncharacterized protein LOC142597777 isoform X3 n=1 Tax=Dermatophagoides farinae TaxID=6954 RepID=UPI003F630845
MGNQSVVVNKQLSNKNDNHSGIIIDNDDHRKQFDNEYEISLDYNNNDDDNSDRETRTMMFTPLSSETNMTTTKTMLIDDTSIMNDADKFINDELNKFHVEESLLCKNSFILNSFILTMKIIFFLFLPAAKLWIQIIVASTALLFFVMFMTITAIMCQKFLHNNNDSKTIQTVDTTTVKTNRRKNHDHRHGRLSSKKRRSSSSSSSRRKKHHRSTTTLPSTNNMAATTTISDSQRKSSSIRYPQHDNNRKLSSLSSTKLLQTKNIQLPIHHHHHHQQQQQQDYRYVYRLSNLHRYHRQMCHVY